MPVISQATFDTLPESVRGRVAALYERMGDRINEVETRRSAWGLNPPNGPIHVADLRHIHPSTIVTVRWQVTGKGAARKDIEAMEGTLNASKKDNIRLDGVAEFDARDKHKPLTDFAEGGMDEGLATAEFEVSDGWHHPAGIPIEHFQDMTPDGPQFKVMDKWNKRGVRCLLVRRWVPTPEEWQDAGEIAYWTGYVYAGPERDPDTLPSSVGTGATVPNITYPSPNSDTPDETGWIGWDNNIEEARVVVSPTMEEHEAKRVTSLLGKAVAEAWQEADVDPTTLYAEGYALPEWLPEDYAAEQPEVTPP